MDILAEIKQARPFPSKAQELTVALLRTADLLHRAVDAVIEPHGITGQQYNVLRILRGAGPDGLPTLEIAQRMIERTPGITRLIDRLQDKRLVQRRRSGRDRRCVYCRITPAGLRLLARLDQPVRAASDAAFETVNKRELAQLAKSLDHLRAHLQGNHGKRRSSP